MDMLICKFDHFSDRYPWVEFAILPVDRSLDCCVAAVYTYKYNINTILSRAIQQRYSQFEGLGKKGRITWPHGGTHLQNEAGAFHAPSVQPDPDPLHSSPAYF